MNTAHQLDLLSFVSDYALADFSVKEKKERTNIARANVSRTQSKPQAPVFNGHVDKHKTFQTFCSGDSNQFAIEAVKRFIANERADFGMIFLKAGSGLGKSHILHSVANELLAKKSTFFIGSPLTMSPAIETFHALKNFDFLLIDDIEEIEESSELQKIFCQLFDYAQSGKMKIIITGAKFPKELAGCDERFKGKLSAALIHHISGMNNALAYNIVSAKSLAMNIALPESVKTLVANQLDYNVYGIESLLYKLKSNSEIKGKAITLEMARQEMQQEEKVVHINFRSFFVKVANAFQISVDELLSPVRRKDYAFARHTAMFILREKENMSVMRIAELFGKDHSSVIYAVDKIKGQIETDHKLKVKIQNILAAV